MNLDELYTLQRLRSIRYRVNGPTQSDSPKYIYPFRDHRLTVPLGSSSSSDSDSQDKELKPFKNPATLPSTIESESEKSSAPCIICKSSDKTKNILRLVIREKTLHLSVVVIFMTIVDGIVKRFVEETINFFRISHSSHSSYHSAYDELEQRPSSAFEKRPKYLRKELNDYAYAACRRYLSKFCNSDHILRDLKHGRDSDMVSSFIDRFAEDVNVAVHWINQTVDHVVTTTNEVLIDIDMDKLRISTNKTEIQIMDIICNMFWRPRAVPNFVTNSKNRRGKYNCWFKAVDYGYVVPFHPAPDFSRFLTEGKFLDGKALRKCIHVVERDTVNVFSWYVSPYFYHFDTPRRYSDKLITFNSVYNARVKLISEDPTSFDTHFAHAVASNFYSQHGYIRRYMCSLGLLENPTIYMKQTVPYVVRSLNPVTRAHIFHLIYKDKVNKRPRYEDIFETIVMLRDIMTRMRLRTVVMPKIGCSCENVDFYKVLEMIMRVFHDTDIDVIIGLNNARCCQMDASDNDNDLEDFNVHRVVNAEQLRCSKMLICDADECQPLEMRSQSRGRLFSQQPVPVYRHFRCRLSKSAPPTDRKSHVSSSDSSNSESCDVSDVVSQNTEIEETDFSP